MASHDLDIYDDVEVFETHPELLHDTPSRRDGIDEETECMLRIYGCELIQECGILLRCHQTAMATGQIIFHRFYFRQSMKKCDVRAVAKAALLLSTKIEEQPRPASDILNVFHASQQFRRGAKISPLEAGTARYYELKQELLDAESAILRELGFVIHAEHAHKFVLYYIRVLYGKTDFHPDLAQKSWNYVNDSYRTLLCVRFRPNVLACGAIFLASRDLGIALPKGWWGLFEASEADVLTVCSGILGLYEMPKAKFVCVHQKEKKEALPTPPPPPLPAPAKDDGPGDVKETPVEKGKDSRGSSSERERSVEEPAPGSKEERERKLELLEKLEEGLMGSKGDDRRGDDRKDKDRDRGGRGGRGGRDSDRDLDRDRDRRRPRSRSPPRKGGRPSRSPRRSRSRSPPRRGGPGGKNARGAPPGRGRSRSRSPPGRRDRGGDRNTERGNSRGVNRDRDRDNGGRERARGGFSGGPGGAGNGDAKGRPGKDRDDDGVRKASRDRDEDEGKSSKSPALGKDSRLKEGDERGSGGRGSEERGRGGGGGEERKVAKGGLDILQAQREWAAKKGKGGDDQDRAGSKDAGGGEKKHAGGKEGDRDVHHQLGDEERALQRLSVAERQKRRAAKFGNPADKKDDIPKPPASDKTAESEADDANEPGPLASKEPERKKFKVRIGQRDDLLNKP